jgi:hypothetical protein
LVLAKAIIDQLNNKICAWEKQADDIPEDLYYIERKHEDKFKEKVEAGLDSSSIIDKYQATKDLGPCDITKLKAALDCALYYKVQEND